jgi:hypothetical protein
LVATGLPLAFTMATAETDVCSDTFVCPITLEIMRDPVFFEGDDHHGHSCERSAALQWVSGGAFTHPVTGAPLTSIALKPNHILRNAINNWRECATTAHPPRHTTLRCYPFMLTQRTYLSLPSTLCDVRRIEVQCSDGLMEHACGHCSLFQLLNVLLTPSHALPLHLAVHRSHLPQSSSFFFLHCRRKIPQDHPS